MLFDKHYEITASGHHRSLLGWLVSHKQTTALSAHARNGPINGIRVATELPPPPLRPVPNKPYGFCGR